jgi:UDP-N-acetylmuramoyl-L-alanyl-D-glutamate--2,6-diaminopimelate ligase
MMLGQLLRGCDGIEDFPPEGIACKTDIAGVAYDSRNIKEGYLFVAMKGEKYDGHDFIGDVIKRGAAAIVRERDTEGITRSHQPSPLYVHAANSRRALACIANNFYERPSECVTLTGITGTNGKTTTSYILKSVLESWGRKVGLIGTIQYMIGDAVCPALHTTPESLEFQSLLREMFLSGCSYVISEVSSHALAQYRVDGAVFRTAVFTNLTRDHLDFHKTMENYFAAKERLFTELLDKEGTAVINSDDPYGKRLVSVLQTLKTGRAVLTYGLEPGADLIAEKARISFDGLTFKISFRGKSYKVVSRLTGMPNVYNILSAIAASLSLGIPWQVILEGVQKTGNITGRFEKVDAGQKFLCVVDYAHTEDALERLILTARGLLEKSKVEQLRREQSAERKAQKRTKIPTRRVLPRVITVFGCGGDRDRGKRPGMGAIATNLSDFVIITSDNPRSEEPLGIIRDIEAGVVSRNYLIEPDRKEAIRKAVAVANEKDIILIAGKGHEDYQEIKGVRHPFSDREVAVEIIKERLNSQRAR